MGYIREALENLDKLRKDLFGENLNEGDELKEFNVTFYDGPNSNRLERLIIKAHNSDEAMEKVYKMPQAEKYNNVIVGERTKGKIAYMVAFKYNYVFRGKVESDKGEGYIAFNANNEPEARRAYNKKYLGKYFKGLNPGKDNIQEKIPTNVQGGKYGNVFDVYQISSESLPSADDAQAIINPTHEALSEDYKEDKYHENSTYGNIKSNGIYSLNTGWVKHPVQQDIPDIDMEAFEKEFKVWEDRYFDLLNALDISSQSKLEEIDNLIEDVYNLRKEGMEEDGEYSIKNLIFKEFRNLGYLDNLKELRKKEISRELSLESLKEELIDYSNEDEINSKTKEIMDIISQQLNEPFIYYTSLDYLSYGEMIEGCDYKDLVKLVVPYIIFNDTEYNVYFTDDLGWSAGNDYIITKKTISLQDLYRSIKKTIEEQGDETLSQKEFEDHVFTIDEDGNYKNVKIN